ncbi:AAA family ATPase [Treponema vincentii]|uniref:AAA family ATPase n=1 Tax=Treponema vincentii TaxID=69710 RepID=UPI0035F5884B
MADTKKEFTHRIGAALRNGIRKGHNSFFFHGTGINDVFFYNYYYGSLSLKETFKHLYLDAQFNNVSTDGTNALSASAEPLAQIFIYAKGEAVFECWQQKNGVYEDCTDSFFAVEQEEDDFSGISSQNAAASAVRQGKATPSSSQQDSQADQAKALVDTLDQNNQKVKNSWQLLTAKIAEKNQKIGIFIEDTQWLLSLYAGNKDPGLTYIKIIQELIKNKKQVLLAFAIPDVDLLKGYGFNFEDKNTIFIGNPTVQELQLAFLRAYMQRTALSEVPITILDELKKIAAGIVAGKNSLRSAMKIFNDVSRKNPQYTVAYNDFKDCWERGVDEEVTLDQVVLDDKIKREIEAAVDAFLENPDQGKKGMIFTGPPGTGKTLIAKALANEKDCYFKAPTLSDLKGEFVGQTSGKVKRIFDELRASQPAILFIDEADTIFPARDLAGSTSDSFNLDMVNQFLVEIDGANTGKQKIFVIAATNRPEILDSAIKSRLGTDIPFKLPEKLQRMDIFEKKLAKYKQTFKNKPFADEIADKTENMSGRDIDNFVKSLAEASRTAYHSELASLTDEQLGGLFFTVLKGREKALIKDLADKKIAIEITPPAEIKMSGYQDVIGYQDIKEIINRQVRFLTATPAERAQAKEYGIMPSRGILLYGPPGNAKSKLAAAAAKEHNLYFIKVLSKDFASINPDATLRNLQLIFAEVFKLSKMCTDIKGILLFFDEFDSLASKSLLSPTVRGTLLDYIADNEKHGLRAEKSNILLMAATNYYKILDEALIRKGRIDEHCFMDNPSRENGLTMLHQFIQNAPHVAECSASIIQNIYDSLHRQNIEKERNKLLDPNEWKGELAKRGYSFNITELSQEKLNRYINEILTNRARPSGADLDNIVQKLRQEAFYTSSFANTGSSGTPSLLNITDEVIERVFRDSNQIAEGVRS